MPNEPFSTHASIQSLIDQIGIYHSIEPPHSPKLATDGRTALYQGIEAYRSLNPNPDPKFHRKKFIEFIMQHEHTLPSYSGHADARKQSPESAATPLKDLLTSEGETLYLKALSEERNSEAYMDAVIQNSLTHYNGPTLTQRPVIIVAGPSGSGKTHATKAFAQEAINFLPKKPGIQDGNDLISIDGSIARETSQIRKLAIQLAIRRGYTGIRDLHDKSLMLDSVKQAVQNATLTTPHLGVIIPETFSNPLISHINPEGFFNPFYKLPNSKIIFTRILGDNPDQFRNAVKWMGVQRAWQIDGFEAPPKPYDLNQSSLPESKAYQPNGFIFGKNGSEHVEKWFLSNDPDKYAMQYANELILLKCTQKSPETWVTGTPEDKEVVLIPQTVYRSWGSSKEPKPDLLTFYNDFKSKLSIRIVPSESVQMQLECEFKKEEILRTHSFQNLSSTSRTNIIKKVLADLPASQGILSWTQHDRHLSAVLEGLQPNEKAAAIHTVSPSVLAQYFHSNKTHFIDFLSSNSVEACKLLIPSIQHRLAEDHLIFQYPYHQDEIKKNPLLSKVERSLLPLMVMAQLPEEKIKLLIPHWNEKVKMEALNDAVMALINPTYSNADKLSFLNELNLSNPKITQKIIESIALSKNNEAAFILFLIQPNLQAYLPSNASIRNSCNRITTISQHNEQATTALITEKTLNSTEKNALLEWLESTDKSRLSAILNDIPNRISQLKQQTPDATTYQRHAGELFNEFIHHNMKLVDYLSPENTALLLTAIHPSLRMNIWSLLEKNVDNHHIHGVFDSLCSMNNPESAEILDRLAANLASGNNTTSSLDTYVNQYFSNDVILYYLNQGNGKIIDSLTNTPQRLERFVDHATDHDLIELMKKDHSGIKESICAHMIASSQQERVKNIMMATGIWKNIELLIKYDQQIILNLEDKMNAYLLTSPQNTQDSTKRTVFYTLKEKSPERLIHILKTISPTSYKALDKLINVLPDAIPYLSNETLQSYIQRKNTIETEVVVKKALRDEPERLKALVFTNTASTTSSMRERLSDLKNDTQLKEEITSTTRPD